MILYIYTRVNFATAINVNKQLDHFERTATILFLNEFILLFC